MPIDISGECAICGTTVDVDEDDGICGECYAEHRYERDGIDSSDRDGEDE